MSTISGKHAQKPKTNKKRKIPIFRIVSLIIIIICGIYIGKWMMENKHTDKIVKIVHSAVVEREDNTISVDFAKLKETNSDVVAWLKVNNTSIDYPIVQGQDNSYYLTHSFDKTYNAAGWPFLDYRVNLNGTDQNMTIYGHNRRDGSMFCTLKDILKPEWYENEENLYISYITEQEEQRYQVFSIYQIEKETYYTTNSFDSEKAFEEFLIEIKGRSKVDFNVDVNSSDKILTLSTCADNNNYRVVLHAKKI